MKQILIRNGQVEITNIPSPVIERGHLLVEVAYSLVSTGTEVNIVETAKKSLVQQAFEQPERVRKLIAILQQQGIQKTVEKIREKMEASTPLGYSCSGRVIQVGPEVKGFQPGDWVACAGAGLANHAEVVLVPANLTVKIPSDCDPRSAASVTLGAIAMQGVRRAGPELGNNFAVIGLGLLGQITVQLLKTAGCYVIGFDLDPRRVELSRSLGADEAFVSNQVNVLAEVQHITGNQGVDATIITAASNSDSIVQQAMEITRKKGRVVVVGAVGMNLQRSPFYEKEIDFLISCSYGPGRYDSVYEQQGQDYPYAYVRWTENRNMVEYLRLVAQGRVRLEAILEKEFEIDKAALAYKSLMNSPEKPLGVILRYPILEGKTEPHKLETRVDLSIARSETNKIGVALVGAGHFATEMHLPNLQKLSNQYMVKAIVDISGVIAKGVAEQFKIDYITTNLEDVLEDASISLVMICTRHNQHARLALEALKKGKHVFVEKPLALTIEELEQIVSFYDAPEKTSPQPVLMTGFNRRFSPFAQRIKEIVSNRRDPMILNYRMNAGYIPLNHWVHSVEGGGRNRGEACHIYDLFTFFTESQVINIETQAVNPVTEYYSSSDNFITTLRFKDDSLATLTYTAMGNPQFPKEQLEIFFDGKILSLNDYRELIIYGTREKGATSKMPEKGHYRELQILANTIQTGGEWPIPLWQQVQATKIALAVEEQLRKR